ncbi:MAG: acetyl-CoA carboxylase carboxyltransferase subunit alpha [Akkermansiaceae bacterium]|nr:acetyl-CoA carboxylase carboxyltransferase subunit alpha [Akkermansiaceae bacterium]MCP5551627.1 acetyl-CoA carboxylase carboxyltransferase subunit alpha [Akkermansiaceae bacterium]
MNCEPLEFEKPVADLERQLNDLRERSEGHDLGLENEIRRIEEKLAKTKMDIYRNLNAWQRVQIARHPQRPFMLDYVGQCFSDYLELHGDRHIGDDESMPGGFGWLEGRRCVVVGHQKGRDTKENLRRNFGSAHPEGYRKALRLMRLGEKFGAPVVALIDTPGAYPGIGAEERNIAEAIAYNLREMMLLRVPIVAVVIGEGGSGGALGIGIADRVLMMENAYYSVISPEGCAAILWKDRKYAKEAAEAMKITAGDLKGLGIVDEVISEPMGGAHHDHVAAGRSLKSALQKHLMELEKLDGKELLDRRYEKFRKYGEFKER